ncbi:hypothetical protein BDZ94DRAFT_1252095 [Collybia nuda]|uniref:Uncharacterized protein n=1 Tax=Collybia nuda TaxID=64659 RepID=A0A9P5YCS9_9AGAR|nr:hypothetical protein BDZ94DRAFT_1252095 [Collybia nuda]
MAEVDMFFIYVFVLVLQLGVSQRNTITKFQCLTGNGLPQAFPYFSTGIVGARS